jgi:hypothetical protein
VFLPQTSRLLGALSSTQLTTALLAALRLAPSDPPWLKARWRSYLSHVRLSLVSTPQTLPAVIELEGGELEVLVRLCELLCMITPCELQPSDAEVRAWLERELKEELKKELKKELETGCFLSDLREAHREVLRKELSLLPERDVLSGACLLSEGDYNQHPTLTPHT